MVNYHLSTTITNKLKYFDHNLNDVCLWDVPLCFQEKMHLSIVFRNAPYFMINDEHRRCWKHQRRKGWLGGCCSVPCFISLLNPLQIKIMMMCFAMRNGHFSLMKHVDGGSFRDFCHFWRVDLEHALYMKSVLVNPSNIKTSALCSSF